MSSELIDNGPSDPDEAEEWMNSPEYQEFVARLAKHCRCVNGPCDGVLAGGQCDGFDEEWAESRRTSFWDDEDDE